MIHENEIENAHFFEWKQINILMNSNYKWHKETHTNYSQIYIEKKKTKLHYIGN